MDTKMLFWKLIILLMLLKRGSGFKFTIVHNNDMHGRIDPVLENGDLCPEGHDERGLCFGGFARVSTAVEAIRDQRPTVFLNAGNTFYGAMWHENAKAELAADLMNMLNPDAVSLGTHEFIDNIQGLWPYFNKTNFPIVCCNLDLQMVPNLKYSKVVYSTINTKLGKMIGIIGHVSPRTRYIVPRNIIRLKDEIFYINLEATMLRRRGVDIIIALGHSGIERNKEIAMNCPEVDVVIGGYSETFPYTGTAPEEDEPVEEYPIVVTNRNGQQVPIIRVDVFTKYLGVTDLEFDNGGILRNFSGNPILLDKSIPHHTRIKDFLNANRDITNKIDYSKYVRKHYFVYDYSVGKRKFRKSNSGFTCASDFIFFCLALFELTLLFE